MSLSMSVSVKIKEAFEAEGLSRFGWTEFQNPKSMDFYLRWIKSKYHGNMKYLEDHIPYKQNPQKLLPSAVGSFCVAVDYVPHPKPEKLFRSLKVARYARGKDYHHWFFQKLQSVALGLKQAFPKHLFLPMTDSKPVLERNLSYLAGLGWVGKNTCLISQKHGSLFLLGEIYTTLKGESAQALVPDRCGRCTKCMDACPTEALIAPKTLDSRKCISYWTIESKQIPPTSLREKIGDWYFGCDVCQTVCPWNIKAFGTFSEPVLPDKEDVIADLREILTSSNSQIRQRFKFTPLNRTNPNGHRRNAIIVATNKRLVALTNEIAQFQDHPYFKNLVAWSLKTLRKGLPC